MDMECFETTIPIDNVQETQSDADTASATPGPSSSVKKRCLYCGVKFSRVDALRRRVRKHEGTMYQCDQCSRKFFSHSDLKTHQNSHTNPPVFKCDMCDKTFDEILQGRNAHVWT